MHNPLSDPKFGETTDPLFDALDRPEAASPSPSWRERTKRTALKMLADPPAANSDQESRTRHAERAVREITSVMPEITVDVADVREWQEQQAATAEARRKARIRVQAEDFIAWRKARQTLRGPRGRDQNGDAS